MKEQVTSTLLTEFQKSAECECRREKAKNIDIHLLERRIGTMPMMMNPVFHMIRGYLKGGVEDELFQSGYLNAVVPLYKRIAAGEDKEEYSAIYASEIVVLHSVSASCDRGAKYDEIYDAVRKYLATEIDRKKTFLM